MRVEGSTLNRKDLFALENLTGPGIRPRPPLPHVNGTDAWGTVAAIGSSVRGWREGDPVVVYPGFYCGECEWCLRGETTACDSYGVIGEQCWGSHAEFVLVPARNLEKAPDGLDGDALACAGGSWLTAWRALVTVAEIRPGDTVLVVGSSGGVGTGAIRIARLAGCRVLAVVSDAGKARRSIEIGADATIDALEPIAARAKVADRRPWRRRCDRLRRRRYLARDHRRAGAVRPDGNLRSHGRRCPTHQHPRNLPAASPHPGRSARIPIGVSCPGVAAGVRSAAAGRPRDDRPRADSRRATDARTAGILREGRASRQATGILRRDTELT